jgi:hypothetical protein
VEERRFSAAKRHIGKSTASAMPTKHYYLNAALGAEGHRIQMDDTGKIALLNSAEYLYLRQISEPRDNALRIVVQEAISNRTKAGSVEIPGIPANLLKGAAPIESTEACKTFILHWTRYIAYLVTEEGVGSCGNYEGEAFTGRFFRVYEKSHFLDHIAQDTGGHFEPFQHYKIICLNHFIDIVSTFSPEIEIIEGREPNPIQ